MPYFYLKGKPILPNNAECPVEVVNDGKTNAYSNGFFENWQLIGLGNITGNKFSFTNLFGNYNGVSFSNIRCEPNTSNTIHFTVSSLTAGKDFIIGIALARPSSNTSTLVSEMVVTQTGTFSIEFNPGSKNTVYFVISSKRLSGAVFVTCEIVLDIVNKKNYSVRITGVTDSGYHLVSPDNNSAVPFLNNQDVFESKLKINGEVQQYCKAGMAPIGTLLKAWNGMEGGGCSIDGFRDGRLRFRQWNGDEFWLSTAENKRNVLTFVLQGAGGGGGGGTISSFVRYWPGGGGASGALVITTVYFDPSKCPINGAEVAYFTCGGGGSGGSGGSLGSTSSGNNGGETKLAIHSTAGTVDGATTIIAYGGGGGAVSGGGAASGGTAGSFATNIASVHSNSVAVIGVFAGRNGGSGGYFASGSATSVGGMSAPSRTTSICTVNSSTLSFNEHGGGNGGVGSNGGAIVNGGGGGSASNFGDGGNGGPMVNSEGTSTNLGGTAGGVGAGGGGGGVLATVAYSGSSGGHGRVAIYY